MRVLAFDQSTTVTGWAIINGGDYEKSGRIDLSNNHDLENRLQHMMMIISGMITAVKPDLVIIEDVQNQTNNATFKTLSQLQGAIMHMCYANETRLSKIAPTSWRKKLGFRQGQKIRRQYLKEQSIDFVRKYCGKTVKDDEADAICIGVSAFYNKSTE